MLLAPYAITLYDESSLFAGKLQTIICRKWGNRIKGRDLYDDVFYLASGTKVNKKHFLVGLAESSVLDGILKKLKNKEFLACRHDKNISHL